MEQVPFWVILKQLLQKSSSSGNQSGLASTNSSPTQCVEWGFSLCLSKFLVQLGKLKCHLVGGFRLGREVTLNNRAPFVCQWDSWPVFLNWTTKLKWWNRDSYPKVMHISACHPSMLLFCLLYSQWIKSPTLEKYDTLQQLQSDLALAHTMLHRLVSLVIKFEDVWSCFSHARLFSLCKCYKL